MEKIPTAEEIMQKHLDPHDCLRLSKCYEMTLEAMIEFAKLHVEQALKDVEQKLNTALDDHLMLEENVCSILENINSYPQNLLVLKS
jgi:hypothetical protein